MRVAVVGAGGQLGAALAHEFAKAHETAAFGRAELDISDEAAVAAVMARVKPALILNAAAFTNVDAAEDHPVEALTGNAFGVRALAQAALSLDATLVHYSTDFVFDGNASTPYTETDPPGPRSVYAASKLLGEWFALDAPRAYVLRVESLFGQLPGAGPPKSSAAVILNAMTSGGSPKVFEDRTITPSYMLDVVRATRLLVERKAPTGLYHCVNTGHCTWVEFAREMARLLGIEPRLTPVRMADLHLRASRPLFCALSNAKLRDIGIDMPTWQDALKTFLQSLGHEVADEIADRE
jgi:dTDP-4-dehydrorhamnose reductase